MGLCSKRLIVLLVLCLGVADNYQRSNPAGGDEIPDRFNRHACAHAVSVRQYTKSNAAQAVMLVSSLLRLLDES